MRLTLWRSITGIYVMSANTKDEMVGVWLVQDQDSMEVVGVYSTRDKAIGASSKYIASFEDEASVKVQMKMIVVDKINA